MPVESRGRIMGVNIVMIPWPRPEKVLAIVATKLLSLASLVNDGIIDQ